MRRKLSKLIVFMVISIFMVENLITEEGKGNLVINPGFEMNDNNDKLPDGWSFHVDKGANMELDAVTKHSGDYAVKFEFEVGAVDSYVFVESSNFEVAPGKKYKRIILFKSKGLKLVTKEGGSTGPGSIYLKIEVIWLDENNGYLGADAEYRFTDNSKWQAVKKEIEAPEGSAKASIKIALCMVPVENLSESAEVWIDDVKIKELIKGDIMSKKDVNLIINPGFEMNEDGLPEYWDVFGGELDTKEVYRPITETGGQWSIKFDIDVTGHAESITFEVASDTKYKISAFVKAPEIQTHGGKIEVIWLDVSQKYIKADAIYFHHGLYWIEKSEIYESPSNAHYARVKLIKGSQKGIIWFDNVSFVLLNQSILNFEKGVPLTEMKDRVVFFDKMLTPRNVICERRLVDWLVKNGFRELDGKSLQTWMNEIIKQKRTYGSVVVMAMGTVPLDISDPPGKKALWYKYLLAGGRIIWLGDPPFYTIQSTDIRPLPLFTDNDAYDVTLGIKGGWNMPYWGKGDYPVEITTEGKKLGFETHDSSMIGFAENTVSIAFSTYEVPGQKVRGAANYMINVCPEMPWSGVIHIAHPFDGRNDAVLRDVWRAANYLGKPVTIPSIPEPYKPPLPASITLKISASGIDGRREFSRGEKVQVMVYVEKSLQASFIRLSLIQTENVIESFKQTFKKSSATFVLDTIRYDYGTYNLQIEAMDELNKSICKVDEKIGIRYVPPQDFHIGIWTGREGGVNIYKEDAKYADIKNSGFEVYLCSLEVNSMDAVLRQNMGFSLRMHGDRGQNKYTYSEKPELFRVGIDRKPYPDGSMGGGRPMLGISHPTILDMEKSSWIKQYSLVAKHPALRPYILTNDDFQIYYGWDFAEHVVRKFKEKTGLEAPTEMKMPTFGVIPDEDPWLRWCLFSLKEITGTFNRAQKEAVTSIRADTRIGPIPGGMQIPLLLMWEASQYPPLNFGDNGHNLVSCYYYNSYWQPQITNTFWLEVGRMGNRELPVWLLASIGYQSAYRSAGYQRSNLFHLLAGGVKGLTYFTYDSRSKEQWNEMKRLSPLIHRISPVQKRIEIPPRDIGLLHSITTNSFNPTYQFPLSYAYDNLIQGHFSVDVICEEEILEGIATKYKAILLYNIKWMRKSVFEALKNHAQNGGLVVLDNTIPFDIPGAKRLDIDLGMGEEKTIGVPEGQAHLSVPGINEYGDSHRIKKIAEKVSEYIQPMFRCEDLSLVGHPFQIGKVSYIWFVNAHTGEEYRFLRTRLGNPEEIIAWEKENIDGKILSASVAFRNLYGIPYDITKGKKLEVSKKDGLYIIIPEMERFGGTLIAFYPDEIESVNISAPTVIHPLKDYSIKIKVLGKNDLISGVVPIRITLTNPKGEVSIFSGVFAAVDGECTFHFTPAINDVQGKWEVIVEELASGKSAKASVLFKK